MGIGDDYHALSQYYVPPIQRKFETVLRLLDPALLASGAYFCEYDDDWKRLNVWFGRDPQAPMHNLDGETWRYEPQNGEILAATTITGDIWNFLSRVDPEIANNRAIDWESGNKISFPDTPDIHRMLDGLIHKLSHARQLEHTLQQPIQAFIQTPQASPRVLKLEDRNADAVQTDMIVTQAGHNTHLACLFLARLINPRIAAGDPIGITVPVAPQTAHAMLSPHLADIQYAVAVTGPDAEASGINRLFTGR